MADNNQKEHYKNLQSIKQLTAEINSMKSKSVALTEDETKSLKILIGEHAKLKKAVVSNNKERIQAALDASKSEESSIKSLNGIYEKLGQTQRNTLDKTSGKFAQTSDGWIKKTSKIGEVNRQIAQLDASDVKQLSALQNERNDLMAGTSFLGKDILDDIASQSAEADNFASMSEKSKSVLEGQHAVLSGIEKTIQGTIDTAIQLYGNLQGAIGGVISGLGVVVGKIGEANMELGTSMFQTDGVARKAGVLSLVFGDAVQTAKDLSSELGDTNKATFGLQASVGLMSTNMGISGTEATKLIGSFSRLNGNSTDTALNMSKTTQEFAKQNGIIPAQLMGDLANSAEEFALFGKDGGENILRAAGYAAKLGVNMATMSGISEGLLDMETSITKELELGAMLGKNINLNKARELAYSGDIEGATKETLKQLGGVEAFNKMDYYQKKQTADLLGVSVAELQKMNSNMEQAGTLGGVVSDTFSVAGETINAGLNKYLGTSLKGLGGMVTAAGQMGTGFKALGPMIGSIGSGLKIAALWAWNGAKAAGKWLLSSAARLGVMIKQLVVGKAAAGGGIATDVATDVAETVAEKGKDLATDKVQSIAENVEVPDAMAGPSMGDKLKDLAGGLKEMGTGKVLFGALNLIPTGIGFLIFTLAYPGLAVVSALGTSAGTGLMNLAIGLGMMGTATVTAGAGNLVLAAIGFAAMTLGAIGLAAIAIGGIPAGAGLSALAVGLSAFGASAPLAIIGIGLLALLGIALIPLTYALSLLSPLVESFGMVITSVFSGVSMLIGSVTTSIGTFMDSITLEKVGAIGLLSLAFMGLAASLMFLGTAGLFALPALLGIAAAAVGIAIVAEIFGFGGDSSSSAETTSLEKESVSVYETNMLQKMDQLIAATSSGKSVYLDKDRVSSSINGGSDDANMMTLYKK